ncbi:MAG: EAL domain-containing protein [Gammaproteobacteria bacterium]|nr:MAG: EAL domain-containing protein [Gammaproteobacteria bacterium]
MQTETRENLRSDNTLVAGLAFILVLMAIIVIVSRFYMGSLQQRMDSLVENHMQKIRLVSVMRVAARERTLSLHKIIQLQDPFERDDEWMRFNANASRFAEARLTLVALPMTDLERQILVLQGQYTGETVPLQDRVVDLAMNGQVAQSAELMINGAVPSQDRVLAQLDRLSDIQEQAAAKAVGQAQAGGRSARNWIITLGALIVAISALVAVGITLRTRHNRRVLNKEKEKAQITLFSIGEGVVTTDAHGHVESFNRVAEQLTGWDAKEVRGRPLVDVFPLRHDADDKPAGDLLAVALQGTGAVATSDDILLVRKDGKEYTVEATVTTILDDQHSVIGSVMVFRDVTEVRALGRELGYQARHDALTGLYNRRAFERRLQRVLDQARSSDECSALCYLDLDLFKVVNDTCGHAAGDELLKQLAVLLRDRVRRHDVLARLGGDEFGILLESCNLEKAEMIANGIKQAIAEFRFVWEDNSFDLGVSIGVVPVQPDSGTLYDVMRAADIACYAAKDKGRNQVCVYSADDLTLVQRQGEMGWVQQIRQALEHDKLCLYLQPISPLCKGCKPMMEVLVRIEVEDGLVMPAAFMPAAERYHLAPMVDRWVIENAVKFIAGIPPSLCHVFDSLSINLSGQSLGEPGMLEFVDSMLARYQLPHECLCFEITETAAITNLSSARVFMEGLKKKGCHFALDDFGSGLSSFAYLKTLPVDYLKIDGTFVRDVATDETDLAMVSSINQVSHIMGIRTVAEYVESEDILQRVSAIGIDFVQGYHVGPPVPCRQEYLEQYVTKWAANDH